jgi:ATP-dependent Lon protease
MFIATANRRDTIPGPLLDRMEMIELAGYTTDEKIAIALQFLVPKQLSDHGLTPDRLEIERDAVLRLVHEYTREAGVRNLEQKIASICRAVAVQIANGEDVHRVADGPYVAEVLGPPRHQDDETEKMGRPGVATGLSWTPSGGQLMFVESSRMQGTGKIHLTGNAGDILKESVATAFTYIRARAGRLGLPADFLTKIDVHVHLPHGAVPKDGPAAGLPVFVSLASMLTRIKVKPDVAVTGEITLRGSILRVDGIKQKCLAAHRAGVKTIVLPKRNEPDLDDVPEHVRAALDIRLVSKIDEVLALVLEIDPLAKEVAPVAAPL